LAVWIDVPTAGCVREQCPLNGTRSTSSRRGDGYAGWAEYAPFNAIVVTAAPDHVPSALIEQLAVNGRLRRLCEPL
jgi:protein-L-isoaspartate O-methyltransferase